MVTVVTIDGLSYRIKMSRQDITSKSEWVTKEWGRIEDRESSPSKDVPKTGVSNNILFVFV